MGFLYGHQRKHHFMKNAIFLLLILFATKGFAQDDGRQLLRGQVLYRGNNVVNENVVNTNTQFATITAENGRFAINVKSGDQLVFTAVNYQLVVEVTEKVTQLDEVVVGPENQQKFLEMKNEKFKDFEYEIDRGTEVENVAYASQNDRIEGRVNFVNIFKAIFKSRNQDTGDANPLKVSEVLRQVYDDEFFVVDLQLPQDQIDAFLLYCDDKVPSQSLLRRENEFELIDFLVTHSKTYLSELNGE